MQNREAIINEYFRLKLMFNRGNKTVNEKTKPRFVIMSLPSNEFIFALGVFDKLPHRMIGLCRWDANLGHWEGAGFLELKNLENYCAELLNEQQAQIGISKNRIFSDQERNILRDQVVKKLRSLGI